MIDPHVEINYIVHDYLGDDVLGNYSTEMGDAWKVVEKVAQLREKNIYKLVSPSDLEIRNICFKPSDYYLTSDGYPLGTTCWYVVLIKDGRRRMICAPTAPLAICMTVLYILEFSPSRRKEFRQAFGIEEPFSDD